MLQIIILSSVVLATYTVTLFNGFVWDDLSLVVGNPAYSTFDLHAIFFSLANNLEYLPLRDLSYAIDFLLWGERAAGFHLTNLLLFLANGIVVYQLTAQLLSSRGQVAEKDREIPLLTALLFVVHPIQSETVSFITCRNVLLSGFFFFLSCSFYLQHLATEGAKSRSFYCGALCCGFAALLSKATTIILPLVLLTLLIVKLGRQCGKRLWGLVPMFCMSGVGFLLFRQVAVATRIIDQPLQIWTGLDGKVARAIQIPLFYLGKLFCPVGFSVDYSVTFASTVTSPRVVACGAILLAILVLAVRFRTVMPELLTGYLVFLITLVPVLNFFLTEPVVADRYAYLPTFGFSLCVAGSAAYAGRRIGATVLWWGAALLVIGLASASAVRSTVWRDSKTLWEDTLRTSPNSLKTHIQLTGIARREGKFEQALALAKKASYLAGSNSIYEYELATQLAAKGDLAGARGALQRVLDSNGQSLLALYSMGVILEKLGVPEDAVEYYRRAIDSPEADVQRLKEQSKQRLNVMRALLPAARRDQSPP